MTDLDAVKAALEKAHTELGDICAEGPHKRFRMSIPARPERDSDLIISDALRHADALAAEVTRLTDAATTARDALRNDQRCLALQTLADVLEGGTE